jgi:hypothetical protein
VPGEGLQAKAKCPMRSRIIGFEKDDVFYVQA